MTAPTPIISFPGNAREALNFYGDVFGCEVKLLTFEERGERGPRGGISEGRLQRGPVVLWGHDVDDHANAFDCQGVTLSIVGLADLPTTYRWFERLAEHGRVLRPLQEVSDKMTMGQVIDQFGLNWLVGYVDLDRNGDGDGDGNPTVRPRHVEHTEPDRETMRSAPADSTKTPPRRGPTHTEM